MPFNVSEKKMTKPKSFPQIKAASLGGFLSYLTELSSEKEEYFEADGVFGYLSDWQISCIEHNPKDKRAVYQLTYNGLI